MYRPFSAEHFLSVLPKTCRRLAVLDRTKEPGSLGEPLYQDVCTVFMERKETPLIVGGRYGLGQKEFNPSMVKAIFDNLSLDQPKNHFTVGIIDDVSGTSLPVAEQIVTSPPGTIRCKFFGFRIRRDRGSQQEFDYHYRGPYRPLHPGVLCLRFQEIRRHYHLPLAVPGPGRFSRPT